jgi:PAS domain S-box-containing protein
MAPTALERSFALDELFFSTTDRKGIIRSGNRVFARVSAYDADELLGAPHNIIRHPDMPRAVFDLLWDYLGADRPIAAFVKNMARDGAYYWVLATVTPIEGGYLSVRMKPSSALMPTVEALYAELRALELAVEQDGGTPRDAIAVSRPRLSERLADLGFADYDAFMFAAVPLELRAREGALRRGRDDAAHRGSRHSALEAALEACHELHAVLLAQLARVDTYAALRQTLVDRTEFILGLADNIRLYSLNAQVSAARLQGDGAALGAIANLLRSRSDTTAEAVSVMSEEMAAVVGTLGTLGFEVATATLQAEMIAQFITEVIEEQRAETASEDHRRDIDSLVQVLGRAVGPLGVSLAELETRLTRLALGVRDLRGEVRQLDALRVAGSIETQRLRQAGAFGVVFEEVRAQVASATDELGALQVVEEALLDTGSRSAVGQLRSSLDRVQSWAAEMLAA